MFRIASLNEEQIKAILNMAILYLDIGDYRELAKAIILRFININLDLEFPLIRIFSKEYIKLEEDKKFFQEIVGSTPCPLLVGFLPAYAESDMKFNGQDETASEHKILSEKIFPQNTKSERIKNN